MEVSLYIDFERLTGRLSKADWKLANPLGTTYKYNYSEIYITKH